MNRRLYILVFLFLNAGATMLYAQDDRIKFGAYGRALQQHNKLGDEDTLNIDNTSNGHVLIDLGININPDKKTEIMAIMRLKSDMGSFFGAGASAALRQMYVRGIIADFINYQVGDVYLKLTPYTFYNNFSEGTQNEATIFSDLRRDYTNYENLSNRGNYWWQQGAYTNFAFSFKNIVDTVRFDAFFLRNRSTNFFSIPTAFHSGGKVTITQSEKLKLGFNYVNLFDVGATIASDTSVQNPVGSLEVNGIITNNEKFVFGFDMEGGFSQMAFKGDTTPSKEGSFFDIGFTYGLKKLGLTFDAGYSYVDPKFYSSAAQSKRVNYNLSPSLFPIYGNDPFNPYSRGVSIFDLVRDPSVYNPSITRQLMAYNPILANAQPYGKATPNRQGFNVAITYKDSAQKVIFNTQASYLTDVSGEGSDNKRTFLVSNTTLSLGINKWIGFKKNLVFSAGYRLESTNRSGEPTESVSLSSNTIDLGLNIEVFKKFDLLAGFKMLSATGNEFLAVRNRYNEVLNYNATGDIQVSQTLMAFGLKYRFSGNTYLTVQDHIFDYKDDVTSEMSYSLNQVIILFNMNF